MAALVQYELGAERVEIRELPVPEPDAGEVVLAVGAVGVCGSDVHQLHGIQSWSVRTPVVLGHEFTGTVAAVGRGVTGFREGDRVVSETAARICAECVYCRSGAYNVCPHRLGFGYGLDGAMAGSVRTPARCLHSIPDSLPAHCAALVEPASVAYTAVVDRSEIRPGDTIVVLGPGPIGLLCLLFARLRGAGAVVVVGLPRDEARRQLARTLGASRTVSPSQVPEVVSSLGDGLGAHLVIDASGATAAFRTAMQVVRPLGQITKVGWGPEPADYTLDPLVAKAVTVRGSFSHTYPTWERVIELLSAGLLDVSPLIGARLPLDSWREGFDRMHNGEIVKAVLHP